MDKLYFNVLAILRARLFTAVTAPALIAIFYTFSIDKFHLVNSIIICIGLICAELLNLLAYDYNTLSIKDPNKLKLYPPVPGNPIIKNLSTKGILIFMTFIGIIGMSVLVYFTIHVGPIIIVFMFTAIAIGSLYVYPFFPYAYLSTALLPPIISGGVCLALTGNFNLNLFLYGLPITWISVAIILIYRQLYADDSSFTKSKTYTIIFFLLFSLINSTVFFVFEIYSKFIIFSSFVVMLIGLFSLINIFKTEKNNYIPSTTVGVLIHTTTSILLALSFLL